jgi:hypothetical protein
MVMPGSLTVNLGIIVIKEYSMALIANPNNSEIVFSGSRWDQAATSPVPYAVAAFGIGGNLCSL